MMKTRSAALPASSSGDEPWAATRQNTALATRLVTDQDDYLTGGRGDVGRPTAPNEHELFVSCAPDVALQQQLEHLQPDFLAIHDLGTHASRKLLVGLAAAGRRPLQRLSIRRQGYGTMLAALEFVELPTDDGRVVRLYSTAAEADTAARHGLARVLLACSRVGAVMVGDLPRHAIGSMLEPFREAMLGGPWPNRDLLLLPLSAGTSLAEQAAQLARGTGVTVRATPQVARPADVWGYLNGTWSRLREDATGNHRLPRLSGAPAGNPVAAREAAQDAYPAAIERRARPRTASGTPVDASPPSASRSSPAPDVLLGRYAREVAALPGVLECCVFDTVRAVPAAAAGTGAASDALARHGKALFDQIDASGTDLDAGGRCAEATLTFGSRHLLLRGLPRRPGLALHAVLDRTSANLTLARLQIERLDALFEPPVGR